MEKKTRSKKFNLGKIIIAVLLCLFCSLSFAGCVSSRGGGMSSGGSSGGGGSGSGTGGSTGGGTGGDTGGGTGSGTGSGSGSGIGGNTGPNINDFNDVFLGAVAVYDMDGTEEAFYDKHTSGLISFNSLAERQFETIATYLYYSLNKVYGSGDTDTSMTINGYGISKRLSYDSVITNANQKIISGLSTGNLDHKEYLNYQNAIDGGYEFIATDNGDGTYTTSYDENTRLEENSWVGKDYFSIDYLKDALGYIYVHQQTVANENGDLSVASDTTLKNYYCNTFKINNAEVINFDINQVKNLGITKKYIWNIAYYVAYALIGEANINNSINNFNTIFTGSQINELTTENFASLPAALKLYKGYNLVVADIVNNIQNLISTSNSSITIGTPDWQNTCFPSVNKEMYIYYDKIDDVCDANNDGESSGDDEDFGDDGEYDESAMDNVDPGTAFKLKKILLIPYIDTSKANINAFEVSGLLMGYRAESAGNYKVDMKVGGLNNNGEAISPTEFVVSGGDNIEGTKVKYDETYKFSEDLVDVSITMGSQLSNMETKDGSDAKTLVEGSFRSSSRTVDYASGGSKTINIGIINAYNQLFDVNGELNAKKSVLEFAFDYYDSSNTKLTDIPLTYLMYFYVF